MYTLIENERVILRDQRHYLTKSGVPVPSVTTILDAVYPKDPGLLTRLMHDTENMEQKRKAGAERGTRVHDMLEQYLLGHIVEFNQSYVTEWEMFAKGQDFIRKYVEAVEYVELQFSSLKQGYGGTADLICHINGERWLIDWKTSNTSLDERKWYLQLTAYRHAIAFETGLAIDRMGVVWLNAKTRKEAEFQGKGWKLFEVQDPGKYHELWDCLLTIYNEFVDIKFWEKEFPLDSGKIDEKILQIKPNV